MYLCVAFFFFVSFLYNQLIYLFMFYLSIVSQVFRIISSLSIPYLESNHLFWNLFKYSSHFCLIKRLGVNFLKSFCVLNSDYFSFTTSTPKIICLFFKYLILQNFFCYSYYSIWLL